MIEINILTSIITFLLGVSSGIYIYEGFNKMALAKKTMKKAAAKKKATKKTTKKK
jgi:hypothetical protein